MAAFAERGGWQVCDDTGRRIPVEQPHYGFRRYSAHPFRRLSEVSSSYYDATVTRLTRGKLVNDRNIAESKFAEPCLERLDGRTSEPRREATPIDVRLKLPLSREPRGHTGCQKAGRLSKELTKSLLSLPLSADRLRYVYSRLLPYR